MEFDKPLIRGHLVRRYKRFLADVDLGSGHVVTAHCANPGAMLGFTSPGTPVWLEPNDNPKRKLKYAWRLLELPSGGVAGVDTGVPNRIVGEALSKGEIPELTGYSSIRPERRYGKNSRIDFLLQEDGRPDCYVEVKNVHLIRDIKGLAEFPDCVTTRGAKHLDEMAEMVGQGARAVMLYVVQRDDAEALALANDLDPGYAKAFDRAFARGVEAIAYRAKLSTDRISLGCALKVLPEQRR